MPSYTSPRWLNKGQLGFSNFPQWFDVKSKRIVTYNAAGVSRRQDQNVNNLVKKFNILEFGYYIWNPYEKCIQKSPNMPGIGSLIREMDVQISEIWETNIPFMLSKTNALILSVNIFEGIIVWECETFSGLAFSIWNLL